MICGSQCSISIASEFPGAPDGHLAKSWGGGREVKLCQLNSTQVTLFLKTILKCTSNSNRINNFKYNKLLYLHEFSLVYINCFLRKPNIFDRNRSSCYRVTSNLTCAQLLANLKKDRRGIFVNANVLLVSENHFIVTTSDATLRDIKGNCSLHETVHDLYYVNR